METIFNSSDIRLGLPEIAILGCCMFAIGFWIGTLKSKKLLKQLAKMDKKIMDLNSELLYNK